MPRIAIQVIAVILSLAAAKISFELLVQHIGTAAPPAWFEAGCSEKDGPSGCAKVLQSRYSYFPAKDPKDRTVRAVPTAFLGLAYYSVLACWLIVVGWPSRRRWWYHLVPLAIVAFGLIGSAYYSYIMFTVLTEWCPWCAVTHGLNLLIAICVLMLWPRKGADEVDSTPAGLAPFPSHRLAITTIALMASVFMAQVYLLHATNRQNLIEVARRNYQKLMDELNRVVRTPGLMLYEWQMQPQADLKIGGNDAVRTDGGPVEELLPVVVFSDLACGGCADTAALLENEIRPKFEGNLAIVYKHYPLNSECNPATDTQMHPYACEAARWAEGARLIAGPDGFWRAHDFLFLNQDRLNAGMMTVEDVATGIGLPADQLAEAAQSKAAGEKIAADATLAKELGIPGTPAIFVNGKRVDRLVARQPFFWDDMARVYWASHEKYRKRKEEEAAATQGSPDSSAAPSPAGAPLP